MEKNRRFSQGASPGELRYDQIPHFLAGLISADGDVRIIPQCGVPTAGGRGESGFTKFFIATIKEVQVSVMSTAGSGSITDRIMGVIQLKAPVYRQIADDTTATGQAGLIVVVVTLIAGFFRGLVNLDFRTGVFSASIVGAIVGAIIGLILGLIGWYIGAWILAFVAKQFGGKTDTGEMLRVTGFVHVFDLVGVLSFLTLVTPALGCLTGLVGLVAAILRLIGYVIGVREAAEFSTGNAIITAIIAAIVEFIIVAVIGGAILGIVLLAAGVGRAAAGG